MDLISVKEIALNKVHSKEKSGKRMKPTQNQSKELITKIIVESIIKPKQTPAITIVELCKRAEIGVGADIAFNNQEEKGN